MIPWDEYIAPEPREWDPWSVAWGSISEGEKIGPEGVYFPRTRWITQRTLQAVGTGVMYGVHALRFLVGGDGSWVGCGDCRADYRERGLFLLADQSAKIGFGAC